MQQVEYFFFSVIIFCYDFLKKIFHHLIIHFHRKVGTDIFIEVIFLFVRENILAQFLRTKIRYTTIICKFRTQNIHGSIEIGQEKLNTRGESCLFR